MPTPRRSHRLLAGLVFALAVLGLRAAPLDPAPEGTFTIAVIPDTQGYFGKGTKEDPEGKEPTTNPVLDAHTRWITSNIAAQRIVFVSHVGDIVDRNNNEQWKLAGELIGRLHGKVPYGLVVGNHDMRLSGESKLFQKTFPAARFAGFDWYGGSHPYVPERPGVSGNNANSYQLISAEGVDLVILHLECNAPDYVLSWADAILEKHRDRIGIVVTHMDLGVIHPRVRGQPAPPVGRMLWTKNHGEHGNSPDQMWDKLYRKHANLRLIFSGDQREVAYAHLVTTGDHGNTVHALMSDYYSNGPMRLYRFAPKEGKLHVITYDTTQQGLVAATEWSWSKYKGGRVTCEPADAPAVDTPERRKHQFTIDLDFRVR